MKSFLFIIFLFALTATTVQAQWSAKDSLWLKDVLSGKDTLRLNPETMESIRQGTFLNPDKLQTPMGSASMELPITKDFKEYFQEEDTTVSKTFKLTDLPSHIVLRYYNPKTPNHLLFSDEYYYFYLKNSTKGIKTQGHDFVHALNMAFSPEYRRFERNKKNAAKLPQYNELPKADLHRKLRKFQAENPELIKPANAAEAARKAELVSEKERSLKKDSLSTNQSSSEPDSVSVEFQEDLFEYKTLPN